MVTPTLFLWRPVLVHSRTPIVVFFELCTKQIMNLQCGASVFRAVTLCADVACLAWVWRMRGQVASAPAGVTAALCSLKPWLQKRLKKRTDCGGKHLGCSNGDKKGIAVRTKWQSGSADGQRRAAALKGEPPPSATRGAPRGKPTRT